MATPEKPSQIAAYDRLVSLFFDKADSQLQQPEDGTFKKFKDGGVLVKYFNERRGPTPHKQIWCSFRKDWIGDVFDFLITPGGLKEVAISNSVIAIRDSGVRADRIAFSYRYPEGNSGKIAIDPYGYIQLPDGGSKRFDKFETWGDKIVDWVEEVIKKNEIGEIPLSLVIPSK